MTTSTASELEAVVQENIEKVTKIEQASLTARSRADVVADAIASFCGSMAFVWVHCIWFGLWLVVNVAPLLPGKLHFDPPPFSNLTLVVSLEAIFLSTFILISQNRQQRAADRRNHLDLQVNLLAEQESSELISMVREIREHLGLKSDLERSRALQEATDPAMLVEQIERSLEIEIKRESPG